MFGYFFYSIILTVWIRIIINFYTLFKGQVNWNLLIKRWRFKLHNSMPINISHHVLFDCFINFVVFSQTSNSSINHSCKFHALIFIVLCYNTHISFYWFDIKVESPSPILSILVFSKNECCLICNWIDSYFSNL